MSDEEARKLLAEVREAEKEWRSANGGGGAYNTFYAYFTVEHVLGLAAALEERVPA